MLLPGGLFDLARHAGKQKDGDGLFFQPDCSQETWALL